MLRFYERARHLGTFKSYNNFMAVSMPIILKVHSKEMPNGHEYCTYFYFLNMLCVGQRIVTVVLCTTGAFLYVRYSFLLIFNKLCDLSLLHSAVRKIYCTGWVGGGLALVIDLPELKALYTGPYKS
jgi:hypothetical protein